MVRINDITRGNHNKTDQFRVRMVKSGDLTYAGNRDVPATLFPGKKIDRTPGGSSGMETSPMFEMTSSDDGSARPRVHRIDSQNSEMSDAAAAGMPPPFRINRNRSPNALIVFVAAICVVVLMMPVSTDTISDPTQSLIPNYLHISLPQKLIAAYVLGLVTMVIFRTWWKTCSAFHDEREIWDNC